MQAAPVTPAAQTFWPALPGQSANRKPDLTGQSANGHGFGGAAISGLLSPSVSPRADQVAVTQQTPVAQIAANLPQAQSPACRFAVLGDAGTGDESQYAIARQLSACQQTLPFRSVMVLGDNVYKEGEPSLFYERIGKPYEDLFQKGVKFFPVMGNHDVKKGFGNWQLAYWGVPPFYNFKLGPKGSDVEFFALDTNLLTPGVEEEGTAGPEETKQKADSQMQWLDQALASSTASMKVVYGHHPMHSKGAAAKPNRDFQQTAMARTLEPLLQKYKVDLFMSGHEHHYEQPVQVNGIYNLVSGAGGKLDTVKRGGAEGNGLVKQLHFMLFDITPQGLTYRTIADNGQTIDAGLIPRKRAESSPSPEATKFGKTDPSLNRLNLRA